jgi:hypothetical protein
VIFCNCGQPACRFGSQFCLNHSSEALAASWTCTFANRARGHSSADCVLYVYLEQSMHRRDMGRRCCVPCATAQCSLAGWHRAGFVFRPACLQLCLCTAQIGFQQSISACSCPCRSQGCAVRYCGSSSQRQAAVLCEVGQSTWCCSCSALCCRPVAFDAGCTNLCSCMTVFAKCTEGSGDMLNEG